MSCAEACFLEAAKEAVTPAAATLGSKADIKRRPPRLAPDSPPLITHCSSGANSPRLTGANCGSMLTPRTTAGTDSSFGTSRSSAVWSTEMISQTFGYPPPQSSGNILGALSMRLVRSS
jgi:hypothetical protein